MQAHTSASGLTGLAEPTLVATELSKRYGGIHALQDVGIVLHGGEIHGLCGENGAGKSTLIKILGGFVRPDAGTVTVDGTPLSLSARTDPGLISIVHQELAIVPTLSVLDNILLGRPGRGPYIRQRYAADVRMQLDNVGLAHVSLDEQAGRLSLAERQLVEIARGISRKARVLLLDEPTATLSDSEIRKVFQTARRLRDQGTAVVFVSHRLDEVFELTDRVTVLRNGTHIFTRATSELTTDTLVRSMIGHDIVSSPPRQPPVFADVARLSVSDLSVEGDFEGVGFSMAPGEIVAVTGQLGSGADRLVETLAGLRSVRSGRVELDGIPTSLDTISRSIAAGVAYVSEDRAGKGVFLDASVGVNLTASVMGEFQRFGFRDARRSAARGRELAQQFQIEARRLPSEVGTLSGGNQQKVSLGKAAAMRPRLLLLNEPTRGVDIGARSEIYATLRRMADTGVSILFFSTDLQEVFDLGERVISIYRGRIVGDVSRTNTDPDRVLHEILSGRRDDVVQAELT